MAVRLNIKLLKDLQPITGRGRYIFPNLQSNRGTLPMSENNVRVALRTMGFSKSVITPHGFRAMFSTIANEHGFNPDVIERQLSHTERNQVRAAYNRAEYLPERIKIMQWWADYLDEFAGK